MINKSESYMGGSQQPNATCARQYLLLSLLVNDMLYLRTSCFASMQCLLQVVAKTLTTHACIANYR